MKRAATLILFIILISAAALSAVSCAPRDKADTVKFEGGEVKMIAHRGLSGMEIENTEAAFIAAGERSYYGIETDVRRTADGKYIIVHDKNLDKLGVKGVTVEEKTLEELLGITIKGGERLCTLEGYISVCKRYGKRAVLELKSDFTAEEIADIMRIISELGYLDSTTVISFEYNDLLAVRAVSPEQRVQYLTSRLDEDELERLISDRIDASIKYTAITKDVVDKLHAEGLEVGCWTVNNRFIAAQLVRLGVDYITTDILE